MIHELLSDSMSPQDDLIHWRGTRQGTFTLEQGGDPVDALLAELEVPHNRHQPGIRLSAPITDSDVYPLSVRKDEYAYP